MGGCGLFIGYYVGVVFLSQQKVVQTTVYVIIDLRHLFMSIE